MKRQGNAANPARFLRPLHFCCGKNMSLTAPKAAQADGRPNGMPAVSVCSNQAFKN